MKLQEELEQRVSRNRIKYFTPNGRQEEVMQAVGSGEYFVVVFSAPNAIGKTALMANVLGGMIFGSSDNPFLHYPLFDNFPFPKRARIASTPKNIEEIGAIQTEIKYWWPAGKFESRKKGKQYDCEYIAGDWVIDIMSYEQDVSEYESVTLGVAIFDEPPPINKFYATIARMRRGGIILLFMTPLDEGGELLEDLQEKESLRVDGEEIGKIKIIYADIEDACEEHGVRGHLKHRDIAQMVSFYTPDEIAARAHGKPSHMTGRIYSDFENKDPYVVEPFKIPDSWERVCIVDPHDGLPFAISWMAIDKTGQIWVYDEFPFDDLEKVTSTNLTIPDYARIIGEKESRDLVNNRIIDPYYGNQRYANTGKTIKQELADLGLNFDDGDTSGIDLGHKRVQEYLKYQKAFPVSATNHPRFHVFSSCRNHWRSMLRYKKKVSKTGEVKDKIVIEETYKHFCDNIRHLAMKAHTIVHQDQPDLGRGYRVVGDLKDVRFDEDDEDAPYSPAYARVKA